jgi:hypothetical protein
MLLERPGEIITRDEMRARLWPAETFVDFDHGVNSAIRRLRDALGDSAESPSFVETLGGRGYRFVFPVEKPPVYGELLIRQAIGHATLLHPFLYVIDSKRAFRFGETERQSWVFFRSSGSTTA